MQITKYPYGEDFQFKILAVMAQDPVFMAVNVDAINSQYFERIHFSTICQLMLNHFNQYRVIPTRESIAAAVEDHVLKSHVPQDVADLLRNTVHWIYNQPIVDADYVKSAVSRFGQRQALKGAVNQIIDRLEKDSDYEDCRSLVEKALQVGMTKNAGIDVGQAFWHLPTMAAASHTYSRRVPTMLPSLDRCLMGGLGAGEFGVVVAPPGIGKSTTLTNFGYGAICNGFKVLHITLELKEIDIALKYAARHTARPIDTIVKHDAMFYQLAQTNPIPASMLQVKYFSPGTATTSNIRALLSFLRGNGFHADLLIVDYIKKMKYDGEAVGGLGRIADELVAIGDDFKCAVWTAQQAQRNYRFNERTNVNGIANDISIIENADVALALSQNEREHKEDRFRIELGKVRRGDDIYVIACWCQYGIATISEMDEGTVAALYGTDTSGGQQP